ncbi:MAG: tetratricopeptide repeat domain protein, partial [Nitrospirae bacterium]|nr:tetratricopeptide repeat domain protein [Nitrospirota bacterium]
MKLLYAIVLLFLFSSVAYSQVNTGEKASASSSESYYYYIMGYQAALAHDWEEALKDYKKALESDLRSIYLKTEICYALYYSGRAAEAVVLLEEVLKESPEDMHALLLAGEIYKNQRKLPDAIQIYKKILNIDPENKEAVFILGGLYYYNNEVD